MDQRHWQEIESILDRILGLDDPQNIQEILSKICEDNPDLYNKIIHLLKNIKEAERKNFLGN